MDKLVTITVLSCFFIGCSVPIGVSAAQRSSPYAIAVETVVQHLQKQQDLFLVDVRSQEAFAQFRIPGSLNIPLFAVKTKGFLKTKPVILIDTGARPRQLNAACQQLAAAGFDAWFLFGGLYAWATAGGELQGDRFAQRALNRIAPATLFAEYDAAWWVLIEVVQDSSPVGIASAAFHNAEALTTSVAFDPDKPRQFLSDLRHVLFDRPDDQFLMLLYTQSGQGYEAIELALKDAELPPVLFLEGGAQAYNRFVAWQEVLKEGPQDISTHCDSCSR